MKRPLLLLSAIALAVLTGCDSQPQSFNEPPLYVSTVSVDAPVKSQYRTFKGKLCPPSKHRSPFAAQEKFSMYWSTRAISSSEVR